jgi:hypothetical protein
VVINDLALGEGGEGVNRFAAEWGDDFDQDEYG